MHETATNEACPRKGIPALVELCLKGERDRHLSARSLRELRRYLKDEIIELLKRSGSW